MVLSMLLHLYHSDIPTFTDKFKGLLCNTWRVQLAEVEYNSNKCYIFIKCNQPIIFIQRPCCVATETQNKKGSSSSLAAHKTYPLYNMKTEVLPKFLTQYLNLTLTQG